MKCKIHIIRFYTIISVFSVITFPLLSNPPLKSEESKNLWLTIVIHGGGAHPMYLNLSDAFKLTNDNLMPSIYSKTTEFLRKDPYFMKFHPQDYIGLQKAWPVTMPEEDYRGGQIFGKLYSEINNFAGLPPTEIYAFGWAGLLSNKARRKAAEKLYEEIYNLYEHKKREGYNPLLRIIAYSNGGNAAMNLAEVVRSKNYTPFHIEQLIIISTPIHTNTQFYLQNGFFKNIYLFYSKGDNIQSSDFLSSPTHSFTHRHFLAREGIIPKNTTQVQIRIFRTKMMIPQKDGSFRGIPRYEMVHPNHTEMFFFGWVPEWYRKYFPIRPLPVGILIPLFLKTIQENHLQGKHLRLTLRPEEDQMTIDIKNSKQKQQRRTVPFLTQQELTYFRKALQKYKPAHVTHKEYHSRMEEHWKNAKKFIRDSFKQKIKAQHQKKKFKDQPVCNVSLFQPITEENQ